MKSHESNPVMVRQISQDRLCLKIKMHVWESHQTVSVQRSFLLLNISCFGGMTFSVFIVSKLTTSLELLVVEHSYQSIALAELRGNNPIN